MANTLGPSGEDKYNKCGCRNGLLVVHNNSTSCHPSRFRSNCRGGAHRVHIDSATVSVLGPKPTTEYEEAVCVSSIASNLPGDAL